MDRKVTYLPCVSAQEYSHHPETSVISVAPFSHKTVPDFFSDGPGFQIQMRDPAVHPTKTHASCPFPDIYTMLQQHFYSFLLKILCEPESVFYAF